MFSKKLTIILCVFVAVMFVAAMASADTDDRSSKIKRKFHNNEILPQTDLHIYFNGPVDAATGVTGYDPPFADITNNGTNVIELSNGTVENCEWTGCMNFSSTMDGLEIDSVKWTPSNQKLGDNDIQVCLGEGGVPTLTGWGMIILALLLVATGIWLYRRRRVSVTA